MTTPLDTVWAEVSEPAAGAPRPRRRASAWAFVSLALAVALVAVLAVVGWRSVAAGALDDVDMGMSDASCRGDGTAVRSRPGVVTVRTSRDMECTFTVQVENRGTRDVHLDQVEADFMGPDTGTVFVATVIDGVEVDVDPHSTDARHVLDADLPAGRTLTFDIYVEFNPRGCNDAGTLTLNRFPQLGVSTMGVERTVHGASDLAFRNDIRTPGCGRLVGS